jgi:DNA-binding PadR family transcriptional regulator
MEKQRPIGANEALVLAVLGRASTINEICNLLQDDPAGNGDIGDGAVYLALKRLCDRGLVSRRTVSRTAADGRMRDVGEYARTTGALEALRQYQQDAQRVIRWIGSEAPA